MSSCYSLEEYEEEIRKLREGGLPSGYETGLRDLDNLVRLDKGRVAVVTGVPQSGKSTFIDFLSVRYHIQHGFNTLFFSTETPLNVHLMSLEKMFQKSTDSCFHHYLYQHFKIMKTDEVYTFDEVLKRAEKTIQACRIDCFVIDNYSDLCCYRQSGTTEYEYASVVLDKLRRFARRHNLICILVAHPKKMEKNFNGSYEIPTAYDIAGSSHFFNKADFCLTVHRDNPQAGICQSRIFCHKCKSSNYGHLGETRLAFDPLAESYYDWPSNGRNFTLPQLNFSYVLSNEMTRKGWKYLDTVVSYFTNVTDTMPQEKTLREILNVIQPQYKQQIEMIRQTADKKTRRDMKAKMLPCMALNCTFNGTRKKENVKAVTRLMYIDIDHDDNPNKNMQEIAQSLRDIDNVFYFQHSASGLGYSCILAIEIEDETEYLSAWQEVADYLLSKGIQVDNSTKNIDRVTFLSYDTNAYINEAAIPFRPSKKQSPNGQQTKNKKRSPTAPHSTQQSMKRAEEIVQMVEQGQLDIAPQYEDYRNLGIALLDTFGLEQAKVFFPKLCKFNKTFDKETALKDLETWHKEYDGRYTVHFPTLEYLLQQAMK